jgi:Cft2 family RNA processing exonuclease
MKKIFLTAVVIAIVIALGSAVKPYWDKYWIQKELEVGAVYGTKNTLENTKVFLLNKLKEEGYRIGEDDIYIEKDSKNNVTVTARYSDKISIFGKELQKLHFTVTATAKEVKEYF